VEKNFEAENPLWTHVQKADPNNYWGLPKFAQELCETDELQAQALPKTDSRLRQDRFALGQKDYKKAASEKSKLEKDERAKRKQRELQGKIWAPKYFVRRTDGPGGPDYSFNGSYWEQRNQRREKLSTKDKEKGNKKND